MASKTEFSRESDYRDYDQRNVADGWPYADGAGATDKPVANRGYGETDANFDRERNGGFRVEAVDADGFSPDPQTPVLPVTDHREVEDQREAEIFEALGDFEDSLLATLDIHVKGHKAILRGAVDTPEERRMIELKVLGVSGIAEVENHITTLGVDSHIPSDAD